MAEQPDNRPVSLNVVTAIRHEPTRTVAENVTLTFHPNGRVEVVPAPRTVIAGIASL